MVRAKQTARKYESINESESSCNYAEKTCDDSEKSCNDLEESSNDSEESCDDSEKGRNESEKSCNDSEKSSDDSEESCDDSEKGRNESEESADDSEKSCDGSEESCNDTEKICDDTDESCDDVNDKIDQLVHLLQSLKETPGKFATDGTLKESPFPGLHIEGVGDVCLPLCATTAKKIIEVARQAPFGLGEKTVFDESVRKTWEIDPSKVSLKNRKFRSRLESLVLEVKSKLGCDSNHVKANLYKLLLYEEGGHFKPHTDSEKENGMFGTLIVQLPSIFKGNHLLVHHRNKTKEVKFDRRKSEFEIMYAAHYADCKHEVTPLESGYRLALIYNLVWTAPSAPPSLDKHESTHQMLANLLPQVDRVFGWTLDHKYSESSLENGISALKGKDRVIAASLKAANKLLDKDKRINFCIAKIKRETIESGDHCGGYRYRDYGEFEPCEITDDSTELSDGYSFHGSKESVKNIPFNVEEDLLDFQKKYDRNVDEFWGDYDDEEVEGPTGNEGSSRSRWYSNYIILAIPNSQRFRLLCKSSFEESLEYLYDESRSDAPEIQPHLKTFLSEFSASPFVKDRFSTKKLVNILAKVADVDLIKLFIKNILLKCSSNYYSWRDSKKPFGIYFEGTEESYCALIQSVPWSDIKPAVENLIALCDVNQFGRWLTVGKSSGLIDIVHKVMEVIISKLNANQWSPKKEEYLFMIQMFQELFQNDDLFSRWWPSFTSLQIFSNIELVVTLISEVPCTRKEGYLHLLNSFIQCLQNARDLDDIGKYSSLVFLVVKPIVMNTNFTDQLQNVCTFLVSSNHLPIIGRLLITLIKYERSLLGTEVGKMFLDAFMDSPSRSKLNDAMEVITVLSYMEQTSNEDFQAKLIHYSNLFHRQSTVPDLPSYASTLSNLFANEDWCNQLDPNLLTNLICAKCINSDFRFYTSAIAMMPVYKSLNYKVLLNSAVRALESYLCNGKAEYELIVDFVRTLLKNGVDIDVFIHFTSSNQLKLDDESKLYSQSNSVLQRLIRDLKSNSSEKFAKLLMVRVENLKIVQARGRPSFDWCQLDAVISDHPQVQAFLRSNQQYFTYRNFTGIGYARKWASMYFGNKSFQISKGYCCSVLTNGTGRKTYASITKENHFYQEKLLLFNKLMKELLQYVSELKIAFPYLLTNAFHQISVSSFTANKRPLAASNSNIPPKKPLKEVIEID